MNIEDFKLVDNFLGLTRSRIDNYERSGSYDINGVEILEGSIINADGYNSDITNLDELKFYCVEYQMNRGIREFGSNIYSDFEPLTRYDKIEVVCHCEDVRHLYEVFENSEEGSGNLGMVLKDIYEEDNLIFNFNSYEDLLSAIEKIENLSIDNNEDKRFHFQMNSLGCDIVFDEHDSGSTIFITSCKTGTYPTKKSNINLYCSRKEALTKLIVNFVKWYNENKEKYNIS